MTAKSVQALFLSALACGCWAQQQFERVVPGGDTECGRGAEFAFYFRQGTVNKLVVDFQGGGGCWDAVTCALPTWADTVGGPPSTTAGLAASRPDNPADGWSYLYVPYCTGDVHIGNGTLPAWGIRFNGRANTQAALDYVYE